MNSIVYNKSTEILNFFNNIPYGVISDGKIFTGHELTDQVFYNEWYLLTPIEIIEYNGGICWDISNAIQMFLNNFQFENYEIYCQMNNDEKASHSFNIVKESEYVYYIIDGAWKRYNKLTKAESIYQCCNIMADRMFNQHKDANKIAFYNLNIHKPYYGCNCEEYMQIAHENKKLFTFTIR